VQTRVALRVSSLVFLVIFLFDAHAQAQSRGEVVRDKRYGILFKTPKDWVSIPIDPSDDLTLHKFQAKRADSANKNNAIAMTASLDLLYFPAQAASTGNSHIASPKKTKQTIPRRPNDKYKNFAHYLDKGLIKSFNAELLKKPRSGKSKSSPLTYYHLVRYAPVGPTTIKIHILAAVFNTINGEYVFQFSCMDEHYKKRHKRDMESMIRSFSLIERESQAERKKELESLNENNRYIQEQIDKLSSGWYHFWSKDKHYMIFSNAEMRFAKKISKNLEAVHASFVRLFPDEPKIKWIPIVRVCKTANEYYGYGGPIGSAGYWSDKAKEFVFYDDVEGGEKNSMIVLRHEAFHHFMHFYVGGNPSIWYDEGHADYFAGAEIKGRNVKIKTNSWRRGTIQSALVQKKYIPLKQFFQLSKKEYYARADLCYAQGWSLIYFLRQGKKQGARMQDRWLEIPDLYLKNFQAALVEWEKKERGTPNDPNNVNRILAGKAQKDAMERTFADWTQRDWDLMEKAWIEFTN